MLINPHSRSILSSVARIHYSRQSSESVASRLSYQSDPGAKMQLFDTVASTGKIKVKLST